MHATALSLISFESGGLLLMAEMSESRCSAEDGALRVKSTSRLTLSISSSGPNTTITGNHADPSDDDEDSSFSLP